MADNLVIIIPRSPTAEAEHGASFDFGHRLVASEPLSAIGNLLMHEATRGVRPSGDLYIESLEIILSTHVAEALNGRRKTNEATRGGLTAKQVREVREFVEANLSTALTMLESGAKPPNCQTHAIREAMIYSRRPKYGGPETSDLVRLQQLEDEIRRLRSSLLAANPPLPTAAACRSSRSLASNAPPSTACAKVVIQVT